MNKDDIFNPNIFTKVIGYGRVSTPGQEDNWSEKSQRSMYAELQKGFNWGDEDFLYDVGSGTSLEQRPKMRELLERIEKNNGDGICAIFVVEQDRLSRPERLYDYARICDALSEFDIKLVVQRTVIDLLEDAGNMVFDLNSFPPHW